MAKVSPDQDRYNSLLDLLTPIAKTYPTEMGIQSVSNGMQCLGGYGYCIDFPLEQLYRDIRIATIYEGTTGIQSIDLLGRKIRTNDGKAFELLSREIRKTLGEAGDMDLLMEYPGLLESALKQYTEIVNHLVSKAQGGRMDEFLADANLFMELSGIIVVAWQWLKQGVAAAKIIGESESRIDYAESKIETMKYFFIYELPKIHGLISTLRNEEKMTIKKKKEYLI